MNCINSVIYCPYFIDTTQCIYTVGRYVKNTQRQQDNELDFKETKILTLNYNLTKFPVKEEMSHIKNETNLTLSFVEENE